MAIDFLGDEIAVLRIYTAEKDHFEGLVFYEWLVQQACRNELAGATVFHGIGSYCLGNPVLAPQFYQFRINQPVVVEVIDRLEKLEDFISKLQNTSPCGIMTLHPAGVRYYGKKKKRQNQ